MKTKSTIEVLAKTCSERGINSETLRPEIFRALTRWYKKGDPMIALMEEHTDRLTNAGLAAQLGYLLEVWNEARVLKLVMSLGGVLDGIVQSTSSSAEAIDDDIGLDRIDGDGDVITYSHGN